MIDETRIDLTEDMEIVIADGDYEALTQHLLQPGGLEQHAFLLCGRAQSGNRCRLLVREIVCARAGDLLSQSPTYLELAPSYYLPAMDRCRQDGMHIIEAHSHPFAGTHVEFSATDIQNETEKFPWYQEKLPWMTAATLVFGRDAVQGHWWEPTTRSIRPVSSLRLVGAHLRRVIPSGSLPEEKIAGGNALFHRQELAFGAAGQHLIRQTRVGLVGCGGLGCHLAQQLAHLGVYQFVLVDPDRVETTNLNRLVGATIDDADAERRKVDVTTDMIRRIRPEAQVTAIGRSIADRDSQRAVAGVDLLLGGTDSDGARLVMNQLAARYLLPYFDLGTGINVRDGLVREAGGQMLYVRPGGFCLQCAGVIDAHQARVDLMDECERGRHVARGYGVSTPQPAVIYLNAQLASLAVGEVMKLVTGMVPPASMALLDILEPRLVAIDPPKPAMGCPICSRAGSYGRGDQTADASYSRSAPAAADAELAAPTIGEEIQANVD